MDMKREDLSMPLPEELVERVLSMVPFPQIFKARTLSKSWRARLSSISSQDDEEKKLLAVSFQTRVCEWSHKWKPFCPLLLFEDFFIAYDDHASQRLRKIPLLATLPDLERMKVKDLVAPYNLHLVTHCSIAGALLLVTSYNLDFMFLLNIFTGRWKKIPFPDGHIWSGFPKRIVSSKDMYKVIQLYTDVGGVCAWICDSKSGAWRRKRLEVLENFHRHHFDMYLNGVIYVMIRHRRWFWGFLGFDVEKETFDLIQMPPTDINSVNALLSLPVVPLVPCNGTVYIVSVEGWRFVTLVEVDLVRRTWAKVIRGPPAALECGFLLRKPSSDGECLFFPGTTERGQVTLNGKVLAYNVRKDEWSYFATNRTVQQWLRPHYPPLSFDVSTFLPGINPFLEV